MRQRNWLLGYLLLAFVGGAAFAQIPDWAAQGKRWWSYVRFLGERSVKHRAYSGAGR